MISREKWKILTHSQKCGQFGQNNCCHLLWKVAQSAINSTIWSRSFIQPPHVEPAPKPTAFFLPQVPLHMNCERLGTRSYYDEEKRRGWGRERGVRWGRRRLISRGRTFLCPIQDKAETTWWFVALLPKQATSRPFKGELLCPREDGSNKAATLSGLLKKSLKRKMKCFLDPLFELRFRFRNKNVFWGLHFFLLFHIFIIQTNIYSTGQI